MLIKFMSIVMSLVLFNNGIHCNNEITELNLSNGELKYLDKNAFTANNSTVTVNLSFNKIKTIEYGSFDNLPNLELLNLTNNLLQLDKCYFGNNLRIKELDLSRTLLHQNEDNSTIKSNVLHLTTAMTMPKLEILYLSQNEIAEIQTDVKEIDEIWPNIIHLYLDDNNISSIDFVDLLPPSLEYLDLSSNNITFGNVSINNLNTINLSQNEISKLCGFEINDCAGIRLKGGNNLRNLYIVESTLNEIEVDAFEKLKQLETLLLSNNEIENVIPGTLKPLKNLELLFFDNNKLTTIPDFHGLNNLTMLYLHNNKIQSVDEFSFAELPNVVYINLDNNQLTNIHPNAFKDLAKLWSLSLVRNKLTILANNVKPDVISDTSYVILENLYSSKLSCLNVANNSLIAMPDDTIYAGIPINIAIAAMGKCYGSYFQCYDCYYDFRNELGAEYVNYTEIDYEDIIKNIFD